MKIIKTAGLSLCAGVALSLGVVTTSVAQTWPSKPITFVVPQSAGGGADVLAREIAMRLHPALGQSVVIENKPGAGGIIGTESVARAAPDGYTYVMGAISTHGINQGLYKNLPYHALEDFTPVAMVASAPLIVVVNPKLPANSVRELIDQAKREPGKITFGSAGTGNSTHLSGELFKNLTGAEIMHVPFKGATQSEIGLMGNHVDLMFSSIMTALPHSKEGRMKALAVTSAQRSSIAPDLPTVNEAAGITGFDVSPWYGLFAPAGTPPEIVAKMHDAVMKVLQMPEVKEKFAGMGAEASNFTQPQFADYVVSEVERWTKVINDAGVTVQ